MANLTLSAQLYTMRDAVSKDLSGTLKALHEVGFTAAELAGFGNLKNAEEVRKAFGDAGLQVSGSHVMLDVLQKNFAGVVADQKTLGNKHVIVPWLPDDMRKLATDWIRTAELFNQFGKKLAAEGLEFSYHNHAFEFDLFDGQTGMNLLLQHTDPTVVGFEVDVYWVAHAKHDVVPFLQSLGSRLRLVHLKDRATDGKFAPVGMGTLDFAAITKAATEAGVPWGVIEQDDCYGADPLSVLKTGYTTLQKLGYK